MMTDILHTLDILRPSPGPVEIRVLLDNKMLTPVRFDDHEQAAKWAASFPDARAIYAVMNPFDPTRITGSAVDDISIVRREWILIDVDPTRPAETNATDEELQAACAVAARVKAFLTTHSWPAPIEALSGNGAHLLYRIDLPNDDASRALIEKLLGYLAATFDTSAAHVDKSVYNASRITKLYGTMSRKGPNTPERPQRISALTYEPQPLEAVSVGLVHAVSNLSPPTKKPKKPRTLLYDMARVLKRVEVFKTWTKGSDTYYQIKCPWAQEHTDNPDGGTILTVSASGAPGFKCQHSHCQERTWKTLRDHLGIVAEDKRTIDPHKVIVVQGGRLTEIVDHAETELLVKTSIYQRGGVLTRAIKLEATMDESERDVHREAGSMMLISVKEPWLLERMGRALPWVRYDQKADDYVFLDPPAIYARTLLGRGEWRFPVLRGVITAPTLGRDGSIIETPGYDARSGLLLDFPVDAFPPVPTHPTLDDAREAMEMLEHPIRAFPFADDAAKSVALSGLLTALVRLSLRTSPLHSYDAPTAGSGKSLLAEMVGLLASGSRPPAMSQGKSEEEDEKRLSTVLFAGDPVIHIDNCERAISGDFLCSMLTQEVVQARILGLSERRILPSTALVLASGNNLIFAGDTSRRSVVCRLDAKMERPDTREFDFDCHEETLLARPILVIAGLTILLAYHNAGRPEKLTPMGSFSDWEWIRGALVWLGHADPADTRGAILENDPRKDELISVMAMWEDVFNGEKVEVADIEKDNRALELRNKLIEVCCHRGAWSGKSVGWWLRRNKDRIVGGRCLRCETGAKKNYWWLAGAGSSVLTLGEPEVFDEEM